VLVKRLARTPPR